MNIEDENEVREYVKKYGKEYTEKELLSLSCIVDDLMEDQEDSWHDLMKNGVLPECGKDPIRPILQLLGSYLCAMPELVALDKMGPLLFEEPLEKMPLYINYTKPEGIWKGIISRWRLTIGK